MLFTVLSCGNSESEVKRLIKFIKLSKASVSLNLNTYQKHVAFQLDTLFYRLNKQGGFNGSIIVGKAGTILYKKHFGIKDKINNSLLNDSSMFQLASVSKVITATSVLMLYERGQIELDKEISFYLKDFPYENITVKELLNHRSGLPNYIYTMNDAIGIPNYQLNNQEIFDFLITNKPKPYLKPNYRFNYCNTNYALLALLVEKISGKPFNEFLKDELFLPLGMKNTKTIKDIDFTKDNIAKAYDLKWKDVTMDASDYVLGDKSVYSTCYDLFLFSEALYQNKIITPQTQTMAYLPYSKEKKNNNYGYGWRMNEFRDSIKKEVFHNGWWHGYRTAFHRRLHDTLTIVVLSNQLNKAAYHTYKVYQILDQTTGEITEEYDE